MLGQVAAPGLRLPVDESDDVQPVLRVLDQLAGDQLTDLASAQDQRVLDVGAGPAAEATRDRPHHGQEADRERPEGDQRIDAGAARARQARGDQQHPYSDRHQVEDLHHVVGGRVVGALLVGAVQALELGDHQPARQRAAEDHHLLGGAEGAGASPEERGDQVRQAESEQVGDHQAAWHQPDPALQIGAAQQGSAVIVHGGDQVAGHECLAGGRIHWWSGRRAARVDLGDGTHGRSMNRDAPSRARPGWPARSNPGLRTGGYLTVRPGDRGNSPSTG